ncbi:Sensor kinase CckA [bacterium HR33]|nr:Sensor kinase CckA [bacterium HR33]
MTLERKKPGSWSLALAVMLVLLPVVHPSLRPHLGPPSHLLWFAHVFPVAMAAYLYGLRGFAAAVPLGVIAVIAGEKSFGAGYGVPADAPTVWALGIAVGVTEFLVGAFALWVRRVEAERARLERLAVAGLDASQDAVLLLDREGRVQYANSAARGMLAVAAQDLRGRRFWGFLLNEEDDRAFEPLDGDRRTVLMQSMAGRVFPAELRTSAVRDAAENTVAWLVSARDRSEELRNEEGRRREQALRELGALVAGIAHELNNPLTSVVTYGEILAQEKDQLPAEAREAAQILAHEGRRAARIARQLLDRVRQRETRLEEFDLNRVVDEAVRARRARFAAHGITVISELDRHLPPVLGRPGEVEQIVANLLANAEDAMYAANGGGVLTIRTRLEQDAAILVVEDDGPGIPVELLPRIFEPFFTTKGDRGTGLGLAIARRIAREAGGDLGAENRKDGGARFTLRLPVAAPKASGEAPPAPAEALAAPLVPKGPLHILVVDDEPHIRSALKRFLEKEGHQVVLAPDLSKAEKAIEEAGFDAILCDVHLPDGTGMELYTILRSLRPQLGCRFVLMTGDMLGADVAAFLAEHPGPHLAKPFELNDVSRALGALVSEPECLPVEEPAAGSGGVAG